jgi:hypothetical protein
MRATTPLSESNSAGDSECRGGRRKEILDAVFDRRGRDQESYVKRQPRVSLRDPAISSNRTSGQRRETARYRPSGQNEIMLFALT